MLQTGKQFLEKQIQINPHDSSGRRKDKNGKEHYYCHYCDSTFLLSFFRNPRAFDTHCSNCSKHNNKRQGDVIPVKKKKKKKVNATTSNISIKGEGTSTDTLTRQTITTSHLSLGDSSLSSLDKECSGEGEKHDNQIYEETEKLLCVASRRRKQTERRKEMKLLNSGLLLLRNEIKLKEKQQKEQFNELELLADSWLHEIRRDCNYTIEVLRATVTARIESNRQMQEKTGMIMLDAVNKLTASLDEEEECVKEVVSSSDVQANLSQKLQTIRSTLSSRAEKHIMNNVDRNKQLETSLSSQLLDVRRDVRQGLDNQERIVQDLLEQTRMESSQKFANVRRLTTKLQTEVEALCATKDM